MNETNSKQLKELQLLSKGIHKKNHGVQEAIKFIDYILNLATLMKHNHGKFSFKIMTFVLWIRDLIRSPYKILSKVDLIRTGACVIDYGCGPGSYSIAAAKMVGPTGKVYAADNNPLAIHEVQWKANKKDITNITALLTDCKIKLSDATVDVVLLSYVLHEFSDRDSIIREFSRVLKPAGVLVVIDHKLSNEKVISIISRASKELKLKTTHVETDSKRKRRMLTFSKESLRN
jgi:ubiquinone/menaquinone biosynthesis C-methylase UbiE